MEEQLKPSSFNVPGAWNKCYDEVRCENIIFMEKIALVLAIIAVDSIDVFENETKVILIKLSNLFLGKK